MFNFGRSDRFCDIRIVVVGRVVNVSLDVLCCCDYVIVDLDRFLLLNGFVDISLGFRIMLIEFLLFGI